VIGQVLPAQQNNGVPAKRLFAESYRLPLVFAPVLIQFKSACRAEHALTVNQTGLFAKQ